MKIHTGIAQKFQLRNTHTFMASVMRSDHFRIVPPYSHLRRLFTLRSNTGWWRGVSWRPCKQCLAVWSTRRELTYSHLGKRKIICKFSRVCQNGIISYNNHIISKLSLPYPTIRLSPTNHVVTSSRSSHFTATDLWVDPAALRDQNQ